ncbi:MAG: zinc-dependent alcohol dehydrogenase family protein [Candidatus Bipolaricaulota bacterium]|nr:zinc-dependent alcohol dehydrogenase family protein [Candidatus Bipolaricaulota bacterium]
MRAITFKEKGEYEYRKAYPVPELGERDVLIDISQCGLCGTDVHIYKGEFEADFPVVIGHEFSGTVEGVGEKVDNFEQGDRVAVNPNTVCNKCEFCRAGKENLCVTLPGLGVNSDGGFAEYAKVPERCVYSIPDSVSFTSAAFVEPLSCAINGINNASIEKGDDVLVLGSGPTGLLLVQLANISGAAKVVSSAKRVKRLEMARRLGATGTINVTERNLKESVENLIGKSGADVVIEAVGAEKTMKQSLQVVRPGGHVVWFGVASPELEIPIKPFEVYRKELTIQGSFVNPYSTKDALDLLAEGKIDVEDLVTHRFGLEQFDRAIEVYSNDDSRIKIMMEP